MKQQVLVIGGGTTFNTHEEYVAYLKNIDIDLEKLKAKKDWKNSLGEILGEDYEVFVPRMPNVTNARYDEWKLWFEKIIAKLNNELILIGHSLGGSFLAKYFNENAPQEIIKALILISPPFEGEEDDPLAEFEMTAPLDNLLKYEDKIYLIHSEDDPVVLKRDFDNYLKELANAKTLIFKDRGHFK